MKRLRNILLRLALASAVLLPAASRSQGVVAGMSFENPIDIGTFSGNFVFSDTKDLTGYEPSPYVYEGTFLYYRFTLAVPMAVTFHSLGSLHGAVRISFVEEDGRIATWDQENGESAIQQEEAMRQLDWTNVDQDPFVFGYQSYHAFEVMMPGTYVLTARTFKPGNAPVTNGVLTTTIRGQAIPEPETLPYPFPGVRGQVTRCEPGARIAASGMDIPMGMNMGILHDGTTVRDSRSIAPYWNICGGAGKDIHYLFDIEADSLDVNIRAVFGSLAMLGVTVYEGRSYDKVMFRKETTANPGLNESAVRLGRGRYLAVVETAVSATGAANDILDVTFGGTKPETPTEPEVPDPEPDDNDDGWGTGEYPDRPIDLGAKSEGFFFSCVRDTREPCYWNHFSDRGGNEVFFRFDLEQPMLVVMHNFGSEQPFVNMRLWTLNEDALPDQQDIPGELIYFEPGEDAEHFEFARHNYGYSYWLKPGRYMVCVEGYKGSNGSSTNGIIRTSIRGTTLERPVAQKMMLGQDPVLAYSVGTLDERTQVDDSRRLRDMWNICGGPGTDANYTFVTDGPLTLVVDAQTSDRTPVSVRLFAGLNYDTPLAVLENRADLKFRAVVPKAGRYTLTVESASADYLGTISTRIAAQTGDVVLSGNRNYIRRVRPLAPAYTAEGLSAEESVQSIHYCDGLGREVQRIGIGASPSGADVVRMTVYDGMGRSDSVSYLPFSVPDNTGMYLHDPRAAQTQYYAALYANDPDRDYACSRRAYASNGLMTAQSDPGYNAAPERHPRRFAYRLNTAQDAVLKLEVQDDGTLHVAGNYDPDLLVVTEDWRQVEADRQQHVFEYRNGANAVVAREVRLPDGECRRTYYVYDDFGRARYVVPPIFSDSLLAGRTYSPARLAAYCSYAEYDAAGNVVRESIPGMEPVYNLYDRRGRIAMVQTGNQRSGGRNEWSFTKYDALDRPVLTGVCSGGSYASHAAALAAQTVFGEQRGTAVHGYTNVCYPVVASENDVLTVNYYDDYDWLPQGTACIFSEADTLDARTFSAVLGMPTGSKHKVLGIEENRWLTSAVYYDADYRTVQSVTELYPAGVEVVSNRHDFAGNVVRTRVKQTVGAQTYAYDKWFDFDRSGRLLAVRQQIAGDTRNGTVSVASYEYDELGRTVRKHIHDGGETTEYAYRLSGMREKAGSPSFSYALGYDRPAAPGLAARADGNLASMTWGDGPELNRGYQFAYDPMGQLADAHLCERDAAGSWQQRSGFREGGIGYDSNGNITTLSRTDAGGGALHELTCAYDGNRLRTVTLNGTASEAYCFDADGNMTYDGLKGVEIAYNILNLPERIFAGPDEIRYIYASDGTKLASVANGSYTYYRNVMVYGRNASSDAEQLLFMLQPEGFVTHNGTGAWTYKYFKKDHLGNTRAVLAADATSSGPSMRVEQTADYYPFGLSWANDDLHLNRYLYNGKELQDAAAGASGPLGYYDFGARYYDPMLGRWFNIDPAFQFANPYLFCGNNPVMYIDEDGRLAWFIPVIVGIIGGTVNVIANWDNIDGVWQGLTTFATGAVAGVATVYSAGLGTGAMMGVAALGGAVVGVNNSLVAQTGKNFSGFGRVDWGLVGKNALINGVASGVGSAVGAWAANADWLVVNGINSPIVRTLVVAPLASGAAHVAGNTVAGMLEGDSFAEAFGKSFSGVGKSMANGLFTGVASTVAVSVAQGINPLTGNKLQTPAPKVQPSSTASGLNFEPSEYDRVTLYRGISGNENTGKTLFMTDSPEYAAEYARKYNTQVNKVVVSKYALQSLIYEGSVTTLNGGYNGAYGTEYNITNVQMKQYILENWTKY